MSVRISAPGKLMIAGEYVVLDGATCVVAAVDARLLAIGSDPASDGSPGSIAGSPDPAGLPPEALLARQHAEASLGVTPMQLTLDKSALHQDGRKLGLGSSSAASAAAAGAVLAWHGEDPAAHRERIFGWALDGHRAVAPQGSGADVAAATLGGVLRYERARPEDTTTLAWPDGLHVEVVWTGTPARTSGLVAKVKDLEAAHPDAHRAAMRPLHAAAEALLGALAEGDPARAVKAAAAHGEAMDGLGQAADAPIVTDTLRETARLASSFGGGAKPSGAGGGDVALAFFADEAAAVSFRKAALSSKLALLPLRLGADGVRQEPSLPTQ